jgi:hypothetical protein
MADVDPFVVQWPSKWVQDPEIGPVITYLNRYLHDLFIVTTAGTGNSIIEDAVVAEKYPWPVSSSFEELDTISYPVIQQEQKAFRAVTVVNSYTAIDHDFINAKSNAQITFPKYPEENSVIIVRNGDNSSIRLSGNGKKINGSSTGRLQRLATAIEFYYFIDSDEWVAK